MRRRHRGLQLRLCQQPPQLRPRLCQRLPQPRPRPCRRPPQLRPRLCQRHPQLRPRLCQRHPQLRRHRSPQLLLCQRLPQLRPRPYQWHSPPTRPRPWLPNLSPGTVGLSRCRALDPLQELTLTLQQSWRACSYLAQCTTSWCSMTLSFTRNR